MRCHTLYICIYNIIYNIYIYIYVLFFCISSVAILAQAATVTKSANNGETCIQRWHWYTAQETKAWGEWCTIPLPFSTWHHWCSIFQRSSRPHCPCPRSHWNHQGLPNLRKCYRAPTIDFAARWKHCPNCPKRSHSQNEHRRRRAGGTRWRQFLLAEPHMVA